MSTIFTKIIQREIPAFIVAEDDKNIAFLDINPLSEGHTLVVPKVEVDYLFDLSTEDYSSLWFFAQKVSKAIGQVTTAKRVGVAVIGLEVPHAHIHLVPISELGDIDFSKPKLLLSKEDLLKVCEKIRNAFSTL